MFTVEGDALPITQRNVRKGKCCLQFSIPESYGFFFQYPPWLAENRDKTNPADLERYETQLRLIQDACKEFEEETPDDPDDVKGQRFERLMVIMQKVSFLLFFQERRECRNFLGFRCKLAVIRPKIWSALCPKAGLWTRRRAYHTWSIKPRPPNPAIQCDHGALVVRVTNDSSEDGR